MATWEDGPEYAPIERPAQFDNPAAPPLSVAAPAPQLAAYAPKDRPRFDDPQAPVAPLAMLHPTVDDQRDPQAPFDVVSSTLTSDSAWGSLHWNPPSGAGSGSWGAPGSPPWSSPQQPMALTSAPAPAPEGGLPSPGTPEWFAPPPYGQPQDVREQGASAVFSAATPGLLICLLIGGLVYVIAPVMLMIAFGLSRRVQVAGRKVRIAFTAATALFGAIVTLGALTNVGGFSEWWHFTGVWALVFCWGMLLVILVIVRQGLSTGEQTNPTNRPWG